MQPSTCLSRIWCGVLLFLALTGGCLLHTASAQIYALPRSDTTAGSAFGADVAIDGERALVSATGEEVCGPNSGAVYVYERNDTTGTWRQTDRLVPSQCEDDAFFGRSIDLSGSYAIVSASSEFFAQRKSNAAYIFERDETGAWTEVVRLTADPDQEEGSFAASVALDGSRALVTSSGSPEGYYGGAAYIFERDETGTWNQTARLTAQAGVQHGVMGGNCALDGNWAAVAASTYFKQKPGSVYLFQRDAAGQWHEATRIGDIDDFFISVALHDDRMLVGEARGGEDESGEASLFAYTSGDWTREATLHPSTPYESGAFGSAVSLDSHRALVTGYDEQLGQDFNIDRVVYVFERTGAQSSWTQRQVIDIGEVDFGTAVDHDGSFAIISSVPEDAPGAAYIVQFF